MSSVVTVGYGRGGTPSPANQRVWGIVILSVMESRNLKLSVIGLEKLEFAVAHI